MNNSVIQNQKEVPKGLTDRPMMQSSPLKRRNRGIMGSLTPLKPLGQSTPGGLGSVRRRRAEPSDTFMTGTGETTQRKRLQPLVSRRRRAKGKLNHGEINLNAPISVCIRVLTNSPTVTLTATTTDMRKKRGPKKGQIFSDDHEIELENNLRQLKKLFGNSNSRILEEKRIQMIKGSEIHQENKQIAINYLEYKTQNLTKKAIERRKHIEEVLKKAVKRKKQLKDKKIHAVNRAFRIHLEAYTKRKNDFEKLKKNFFVHL